jgi:hypothetical protein
MQSRLRKEVISTGRADGISTGKEWPLDAGTGGLIDNRERDAALYSARFGIAWRNGNQKFALRNGQARSLGSQRL